MFGEGGPIKRTATWFAEKLADLLLGGDVLDPRRDGAEIDWEGMEIEKPRRTIVAVMARIQLELALGAADRGLDGIFDDEECRKAVEAAKNLKGEESLAARLTGDCTVVLGISDGGDLEVQVSGSGKTFEVLCDELWNRSKEVRDGGTKKPELLAEAGL